MNVRLISISGVVLAVHVLVIGAFWLGLRRGEASRPPAEREDYAVIDEGAERPPDVAPVVQERPRETTVRPAATPTARPDTSTTAEPKIHVVASGESFWRIANRYGVSVKELMAANNYGANDTLQVGAKLKIPQS